MQHVVTAEEMKKMDSRTISEIGVPSAVLMERAALAAAEELKGESAVIVLCGSGNNGGDGFACARILHLWGIRADVCFLGNPEHMTDECRRQSGICAALGIREISEPDFSGYTAAVDAIFGIGLTREISGRYAEVIRALNESGIRVLAMDIPSGVAADTGQILGCAVKADVTVTMQCLKPGMLLYPGAACAGHIKTAEIGVADFEKNDPSVAVIDEDDLPRLLPERDPSANKGTYGKLLVIAGAVNMSGAACLCAEAAMRSGAGMVKVISPAENRTIIQSLLPEVLYSPRSDDTDPLMAVKDSLAWADAVVCGPGLGKSEASKEIVYWLIRNCKKPMIMDADALNLIAEDPEILHSAGEGLIITPHIGEMSRLDGKPLSAIKSNPLAAAFGFASAFHVICVLKDARTVTAAPDGRIRINIRGTDGMATAGSGDVLSGIIGAMLARGCQPEIAACTGVLIHALAGERAAESRSRSGMTAGDIVKELSKMSL